MSIIANKAEESYPQELDSMTECSTSRNLERRIGFSHGYRRAIKDTLEIANEDCDEIAISNVVDYCERLINEQQEY